MTQILIVEDNLDYAEEMAEFLTELEHEVHITNNASDMWTALSQGNVGVVVLDPVSYTHLTLPTIYSV